MGSLRQGSLLALLSSTPALIGSDPKLKWYPPSENKVNSLKGAIDGEGTYGFIFDSSVTPDEKYGTYNWCNMPHARKREYKKPEKEYELQYVEVVSSTSLLSVELSENLLSFRSKDITSALPTQPTRFQWNHTNGTAITRVCTTSADNSPMNPNPTLKGTGKALYPTLIPSFPPDGSDLANFPKLQLKVSTTHGCTAKIFTKCTTTF